MASRCAFETDDRPAAATILRDRSGNVAAALADIDSGDEYRVSQRSPLTASSGTWFA